MKTLLLSTLALTLAIASPTFAACGGDKGGGNRGNGGNRGGQNLRDQNCNDDLGGGFPTDNLVSNDQAFEPFHSTYIVQPGDTFPKISFKEYATSAKASQIARFNRLPLNAALVTGQRLLLPSIASNGALRASRAPAAETAAEATTKFAAPQTAAPATAATPATGVGFAAPDANLPSVSVGSSLSLDGVQFGEDAGSVRLKFGPVSFPVTVLEWTAASVKVTLPTVELETATPAAIEVFRADGTLASQSNVNLTPAGDQVAQAE
jgi:hypothetical protein